MKMPGLVAMPIDNRARAMIAHSTLWHFTKPRHLEAIRRGSAKGSNAEQVHLKAARGWSFNPTKLFRDWSVLDSNFSLKDYSHYQYFFMGQPKHREAAFLKLQGITSVIQVNGADLLKFCPGRIFFRSFDRAVVLRGDYDGPAIVLGEYKPA